MVTFFRILSSCGVTWPSICRGPSGVLGGLVKLGLQSEHKTLIIQLKCDISNIIMLQWNTSIQLLLNFLSSNKAREGEFIWTRIVT